MNSKRQRLYINGYTMPLSLILWTRDAGHRSSSTPADPPLLTFNAGVYRLEEISMWQMERQAYQVVDDMFGRLDSDQ